MTRAMGWLVLGVVLAACEVGMEAGTGAGPVGLPGAEVEKPLPWGPSDAPSIFTADLTYKLDALPQQGEAASIPWPSSYWPTYEDSINHPWDGAQSEPATTKYGRAFNVTGVEDGVSRLRGVDAYSSRKACKAQSECDAQLGETCGKRAGQESGRCIPTWWGICHAWGPASILVPEPRHPVTLNGVTFKVNDIKALATLVHDRVETKFVGLRCEQDEGRKQIEYDETGRPRAGECIDTNPATWHLLATNFLGIKRQAFVMDRTFDDEVWNQPLRGYRVTSQREVTAVEANALVGVLPAGGAEESQTVQAKTGEWKHLAATAVVAGTSFRVAMSGTGDADLYVKFGSQPTSAAYDCRPYGSSSDETCELTVPAGVTQAFISVHGYADASVSLKINRGGALPVDYRFNAGARRFFEVKMDVQYIGESASETDGALLGNVGAYTHTDHLQYLLEADADGKLLGGEWLGDSKRLHPDFLWLPVRVTATTVAGGKIKVADVQRLVDLSVATEETGPVQSTEKSLTETGTVARGELRHFGPYRVAAGASFVVDMTGSGDADLHVRKGMAPTLTAYDCRPYAGNSTESCTVAGPADVYVAVNGYAASSAFSLAIRYREPAGTGEGTVTPPPPVTAHLDVTGHLNQGQTAQYTLPVRAGRAVTVRTHSATDVDLYLQFGRVATTSDYAQRGYTDSGEETLTYTPAADGTLHLTVHGYAAADYRLVTSDN